MLKRSTILVALAFVGCGDDGSGAIDIPTLETDFAIYGTASAGRALAAPSVRIVVTSALSDLSPEVIAGSDVDMMFAGLSSEDLPLGIEPTDLELVSANDDLARPLPTLHNPHVMDVPSPGDAPTPLVPVRGPGIAKAREDERDARLRTLLSDLAIASPCTELASPFTVTTPRISSDAVNKMKTLSNGSTFITFTTTSTILVAFIPPGSGELQARPIPTGTVASVPGERASVYGFGNTEIAYDGEQWPEELAVTYAGTGFGSVGTVLRWDARRNHYVDDTPPIADTFPRVLYGIQHVVIEGVDSVCTYGGAQGSDRRAAIWCRPVNGTEWSVFDFGMSFGVTSIVARQNAPLVATDLAGGVWELEPRGWRPIFESGINANCDPLCASFGATWFDPSSTNNLAVIGGTNTQLLYVRPSGASVQAVAPATLDDALFSDERFGAEKPLWFSAITTDPSGATWVGTTRPELFRVKAGQEKFERICLPPEVIGNPITAIHARADGRFFLGMSPVLFAYGDWR